MAGTTVPQFLHSVSQEEIGPKDRMPLDSAGLSIIFMKAGSPRQVATRSFTRHVTAITSLRLRVWSRSTRWPRGSLETVLTSRGFFVARPFAYLATTPTKFFSESDDAAHNSQKHSRSPGCKGTQSRPTDLPFQIGSNLLPRDASLGRFPEFFRTMLQLNNSFGRQVGVCFGHQPRVPSQAGSEAFIPVCGEVRLDFVCRARWRGL